MMFNLNLLLKKQLSLDVFLTLVIPLRRKRKLQNTLFFCLLQCLYFLLNFFNFFNTELFDVGMPLFPILFGYFLIDRVLAKNLILQPFCSSFEILFRLNTVASKKTFNVGLLCFVRSKSSTTSYRLRRRRRRTKIPVCP